MARMYERVKLVRPIHLDFTGDLVEAGTEAIVIDLLDDDVVLIEFDLDAPELAGGKRFQSTITEVHNLIPVS